jgi:hypothetical protein
MKVTSKTEKEIFEMNLLPDGWYPISVDKAEEKRSKAGNEMLVLNLRVYRGDGFTFVTDYIVDNVFNARKLRHLAEMTDLLDYYEAGELNVSDLPGKEGYARIGIQKSKDAQFADKNVVWDFSKEMKELEAPKAKAPEKKMSDDMEGDSSIPF